MGVTRAVINHLVMANGMFALSFQLKSHIFQSLDQKESGDPRCSGKESTGTEVVAV